MSELGRYPATIEALIEQGHKVRIERGRWQYKRPVRQTKKECAQ